jgi:hypothetical protein
MSDALSSANTRSCIGGSRPAPGFFPARASPISVLGQIRNRSVLCMRVQEIPNTSKGTSRNRMPTSVAVTGVVFPARMRIGTPAQRHESSASRTATKVSTVDTGSGERAERADLP